MARDFPGLGDPRLLFLWASRRPLRLFATVCSRWPRGLVRDVRLEARSGSCVQRKNHGSTSLVEPQGGFSCLPGPESSPEAGFPATCAGREFSVPSWVAKWAGSDLGAPYAQQRPFADSTKRKGPMDLKVGTSGEARFFGYLGHSRALMPTSEKNTTPPQRRKFRTS